MCATGSDMRTYFHAKSVRTGPDPKWVDTLVEIIVEEYLPLNFFEKPTTPGNSEINEINFTGTVENTKLISQ